MLNKLFANPHVGFAAGVRTCTFYSLATLPQTDVPPRHLPPKAGYVVAACLLIANAIMSPNPDRKNIPKPKMAPIKSLFTVPYTCLVIGAALMNFGLWFPSAFSLFSGDAVVVVVVVVVVAMEKKTRRN